MALLCTVLDHCRSSCTSSDSEFLAGAVVVFYTGSSWVLVISCHWLLNTPLNMCVCIELIFVYYWWFCVTVTAVVWQ